MLPAPFESSNGTTQLIQTAPKVLSKEQLLCILEAQERLAERPSLEVVETSSAAQVVAEQIDPNARTIDAQIRAVEQATPTEIEAAVRAAAEQPGFRSLLTKDFNPQSASASGTLATVSHDVAVEGGAGQGGDSPLTPIRLRSQEIVSSVGGDIRVFGSGITSAEFGNIIGDSLLIVTPAAVVLILVFLVFSYRDLIDLLLGILALVMAPIRTFSFMGIAGIPFLQLLIAIPPLLLAVGIDFGFTRSIATARSAPRAGGSTNRCGSRPISRSSPSSLSPGPPSSGSDRTSSVTSRRPGSSASSPRSGSRLPFSSSGSSCRRRRYRPTASASYDLPEFGVSPLGEEGSVVGRILSVGATISRKAPYALLAVALLVTVVGGV